MTTKQVKITVISVALVASVGILILLALNLMKYAMAFGAGAIVGAIVYHLVLKKFSKKSDKVEEAVVAEEPVKGGAA